MTETFLPPPGSRNTVPAEACESAARWEALRAHYYRQVEVHPEFADYCLALAAYYAQLLPIGCCRLRWTHGEELRRGECL